MPESIQRSRGRPQGYKFNRGGQPTEFGPFIGYVVNNIDPTRMGRLQVWIEQFGSSNADGSPNFDDETGWRTVSYLPPFYGYLPNTGPTAGVGTFTGNPQSYGMWFTPPDLYTAVICFFVGGDPTQGYYLGCVPEPGINHMVPAVGASSIYNIDNPGQKTYMTGAAQLPVTEVNNENQQIFEDPRFFAKPKPVHSYVAGVMLQQGLIKDTTRGPISSSAQRESPSAVFGISTPGRPVYQGGLTDADIKGKIERGEIKSNQVEIIARRGGHSIVMDDGDLSGQNDLVRIRTAKGHQITMSDDGNCFYFIHSNGQTWLEFGQQGTVDLYSTNSVNVRTQGTINLHADKDINVYAGGSFNVKAKNNIKIESDANMDLIGVKKLTAYSKHSVGVRSDGLLALQSRSGSWNAGASLSLVAGSILLNSGGAAPVLPPNLFKDITLSDTFFVPNQGWVVRYNSLKTIVTRAPTHEPYPYHNQGVNNQTQLSSLPVTDLAQNTATTLANVANSPVTNPIDSAAYLNQTPAEISVGSLNTNQITGMLAQQSSIVNQNADTVSIKGIGLYGLTPNQLESAGYLKPGVNQNYLDGTLPKLLNVLSNPTVWTGKGGVTNLTNLLTNPGLQSATTNDIMSVSLSGLRQAGVVTGNENPRDLAAMVQVASQYGVPTAVQWINGQAPASSIANINASARSAQYAVDFVNNKATQIETSTINLVGYVDTTQRTAVDQAVVNVIDNSKVQAPNFTNVNSLYAGTRDADLTYSGNDPIVLANINAERIRRGLSPLPTPE